VPTWPPAGEPVKLEVTRDTWLSAVGEERVGSNGGAGQLKLKGQQEYCIFDVDAAALKGKLITGALWHFHSASPDAPILRVTVSTLACPWVEGTATGYQPQQGSSCFNQAELGKRDWTYPGSTFMDAAYGLGHTIWRFAESAAPDKNGWQSAAVAADVVAARVAGLSHGFAAYDDVGNTWSYKDDKFDFQYFPNRFIHSRESGQFAPYLEVWTSGTDDTPPQPVKAVTVETAGFPAGQALVTWATPPDAGGGKTLGFHVSYEAGGKQTEMPRYLIPMAGRPGEQVRMHIQDLPFQPGERVKLTICPVDSAANVGPAFTKAIEVSANPPVFKIAPAGIEPFPPSEKLPEVGGLKVAVVDLLDKITATGRMVPDRPAGYKGGNHIWSAQQRLIRLQAARNEHVCFQLNLEGQSQEVQVKLAFDEKAALKAGVQRFDYVQTRLGPVPDVVVPLKGAFAVPFKDDPEAAGARNVSLLCEVYVPHEAKPGRQTGTLTITSAGESLEVKVELTVWDFTLPNRLSFVPEMNAYGTVTPTGAGLAYYRLAHEHRLCLNRLYYSWNGSAALAPKWTGKGLDFAQWDGWFGPLLDGSAFADLPRKGEPVDVFYTHFNENWPIDVFENYSKNYWADEAFKPAYKEGLKTAFAAFAAHCNDKGWHDTVFELYLNNKVYYKAQPRVGWRGSAAPWIFDEPVGTQDFWALRWYGILWHQAVGPVKGKARMWYRCDISYSQFGRNLMWGVMDLVHFGGSDAQKVRQKHDEQVLWGPTYFCEYGSANDPADANLQPPLWCLKAWSRGAVGGRHWAVHPARRRGGSVGPAEGLPPRPAGCGIPDAAGRRAWPAAICRGRRGSPDGGLGRHGAEAQ